MKKILSLTSKDFETGFSSGAEQADLGLIYSGSRINPFITKGTLRWSQEPVEIGAGTVVGNPQAFVFNSQDSYSLDHLGNIYKISDVFGTPVVSTWKTAVETGASTASYGLEVFQTKNSDKYVYYWFKTAIGRVKISDASISATSGWKTITAGYQSEVTPTLRIDDEIYFGSNYVISKIADNDSSDTDLTEAILDLPKDYIITALSTDGDYLIISASKSLSASVLDYNDTRIYFWDYKNNLPSWTKSYPIQDPQIRGMITVAGITYAVGQSGLYAFTFGQEPQRIREDVRCVTGYGAISRIKDAISFADQTSCITYGKLKPGVKTALFKPYVMPADINALNTSASSSYGLFGTTGAKMYRQNLFTVPTNYNGTSIRTAKIDLGDKFTIKRIEFVFLSALTTNDAIIVQLQGNDATANYGTIATTTHGGLYNAIATPAAQEMTADAIALQLSACYGTFRIRQIDIYGEEINRSN